MVKLRPPRESGIVSSCFGFLVDFADFCLSTSVLFFALRIELDLLFSVLDWIGADLFLAWPRPSDLLCAGLEPVRECFAGGLDV